MNFILIAKCFPVVVFISPYITQAAKMAFTPILKGHPEYDNIVRLGAIVVAGLVGAGSLFLFGINPSNVTDWVITIATVVGYSLLGGPGAMAAYSFLNSYLHQTPPVVTPKTSNSGVIKSPADVIGAGNDSQDQRQPY